MYVCVDEKLWRMGVGSLRTPATAVWKQQLQAVSGPHTARVAVGHGDALCYTCVFLEQKVELLGSLGLKRPHIQQGLTMLEAAISSWIQAFLVVAMQSRLQLTLRPSCRAST